MTSWSFDALMGLCRREVGNANLCLNKALFFFSPWYIQISAQHDYRIFQQLLQKTKPYLPTVERATILDMGSGARGPFTLLFHSLGAKVIGIDLNVLAASDNFSKYRHILNNEGIRQFLNKLIYDAYYDKVYYRSLQDASDFPLKFEGLDLRKMDASHTSFGVEMFDLVVSNAVFEHVKNVAETLKEMKRVMKRNAIMYSEIHLFHSLTGGHNTLWSNPETKQVILGCVDPWDHLRKKKQKIDSSLNRLREDQYRKFFSNEFEILSWEPEYMEPDNYLTPELRSEMSGYSEEELLKRSIVVIARKI